jgi:hypothetical protein
VTCRAASFNESTKAPSPVAVPLVASRVVAGDKVTESRFHVFLKQFALELLIFRVIRARQIKDTSAEGINSHPRSVH